MVLHSDVFDGLYNVNITQLFNHLVPLAVKLPVVSNSLSELTGGLVLHWLDLLSLVGKKPHKDLTIDGVLLHVVDLLSHFFVLFTFFLSGLSFFLSNLLDLIISSFHCLFSINDSVLKVLETGICFCVLLLSLKVDRFVSKIELGK